MCKLSKHAEKLDTLIQFDQDIWAEFARATVVPLFDYFIQEASHSAQWVLQQRNMAQHSEDAQRINIMLDSVVVYDALFQRALNYTNNIEQRQQVFLAWAKFNVNCNKPGMAAAIFSSCRDQYPNDEQICVAELKTELTKFKQQLLQQKSQLRIHPTVKPAKQAPAAQSRRAEKKSHTLR